MGQTAIRCTGVVGHYITCISSIENETPDTDLSKINT